ncbi:MAG: NAD(P)/FAD-dependent oxidoreductase [Pseudomonadota bacterium]
MSTLPLNPDVIVVGAGTAGLSAAKSLQEAGLEVVVLEAEGHVGGRCITDTATFSVPFDRGGSWLHSAEINPLAEIAEKNGLTLHKKPWEWERVYSQGKILDQSELVRYRDYQERIWEAINHAGAADDDVVIEHVLPDYAFRDTAKQFIPQLLGGNPDVTSVKDVFRFRDAEGDWLVSGGLGSFVKSLHSEVPVELNCPVRKIDYSGPGVCVETAKGTVRADYLILTVSTGVLAAEAIEFLPSLPNRKLDAVNGLPNGLLNKVGIEFDPKWEEAQEGYMADYHEGGDDCCNLLFGFFGTGLAVGFTSGRFADSLEIEEPGAATEFCLSGLKALFGNDVTRHILKTSETAWRSNPYTFGSYSYARPGLADSRKVLAEPLNDRLFFAGEATIPTAFATVHGAYLSGKEVARKISDLAGKLEA